MRRSKHRGLLSRLSLHSVIACLAVFLVGCGSTITTRVQSRPALPVPIGMLNRAQINRNVDTIKRQSGLRIKPGESPAAVRQLVLLAQANPQRLTEAAQVALQQAQALPASRGDERGGFALAACEIAYQSLRESGLPASSWLTSEETREPIATYNTALAMFVFEYSKKLAVGTATLSVRTPLGPRIVTVRYAPGSRYTAGYFEALFRPTTSGLLVSGGGSGWTDSACRWSVCASVRKPGQPSSVSNRRIATSSWRWDALENSNPAGMDLAWILHFSTSIGLRPCK
ncbi:MAG TPA: hypothetical protein VFO90_07125 [Terrimicrobiaceae bacterium]|nr:hypothetical protein [Terrimicrobiaceae bacterium]